MVQWVIAGELSTLAHGIESIQSPPASNLAGLITFPVTVRLLLPFLICEVISVEAEMWSVEELYLDVTYYILMMRCAMSWALPSMPR